MPEYRFSSFNNCSSPVKDADGMCVVWGMVYRKDTIWGLTVIFVHFYEPKSKVKF